ncbi:MAG TPA: MurR/RpiR family transcriptional regulator [Firmicutes bacterium]|nr:MurR/RpiR family transcriptional regulator [Bacillota bacterium]
MKRIAEAAKELSEAQRQVAEFIVKSPETVAFLTAARLGQEVGVSESSVVRTAMALGYSGYPEMQRAIQEMLKGRLTTVERLRGSKRGIEKGESIPESVMRADIEYIQATLAELSLDDFERAVKALCKARRVFVIGLRSAWAMAFFLGYSLNWVLRNVTIISNNAGEGLEQIMCVKPADVAVAISVPRYTRLTVDLFTLAKKRGATTIGITDSVLSPLSSCSDILLIAKSGMPSFNDSFVAPLSLINALIAGVGAENEAGTAEALEELEPLWEEHGIYVADKSKER